MTMWPVPIPEILWVLHFLPSCWFHYCNIILCTLLRAELLCTLSIQS